MGEAALMYGASPTRRLTMIYVLIADGEVDQVCETKRDKDREVRDLRKMGCHVIAHAFATWDSAQAFIDKKQGY